LHRGTVVDLKKDANSDVVLNQLYQLTPLQRSFGIIMLSIVNNKPEIVPTLRRVIRAAFASVSLYEVAHYTHRTLHVNSCMEYILTLNNRRS